MQHHFIAKKPISGYNLNIPIAFLLGFYIFILPFSDLFFYNGKRIAEISLIILSLVIFSVSNSFQKTNRLAPLAATKLPFLLLIVAGLSCISAITSPSPVHAFIEIITLFSLLLITTQCAPIWQSFPKIIPYLTIVLLLSIGIQEVKFLTYYCAFLITNDTFDIYSFVISFSNPRFFNQYQIWTLPFLTIILLLDHPYLQNKRIKYLLWGIAIIWWIMCFTTEGRGAIVAIIGSYFSIFLIFRKKAKDFLNRTLLLFVIGYLLYQCFFHFIPYLMANNSFAEQLLELNTSGNGRIYLWLKAIDYILENPWFGIGPMHYAWYPNKIAAHPHNSILQIAAEWGLPVLLLTLFLFYKGCYAWVKKFNAHTLNPTTKNHNLMVIALTFSMSSALILSLFSGVIVMPMSHLTGVLVVSIALGIYQNKSIIISPVNKKNHWGLTFLFALLPIVYFWLLAPELIPRLIDPLFEPTNSLTGRRPRFWLFGSILK